MREPAAGAVGDRAYNIAILLFLLLALPLPALAEYRTFEVESLSVIFDSDWPTLCAPGYVPIRFDITNHAEVREIEIIASSQHWFSPYRRRGSPWGGGMEMGRTEIIQRVRLKRGDRKKFTLALPVFADNESFTFRLREKGRFIDGFTTHASFSSAHPITETPVLMATNATSPLGLLASGWLRPMPPSRGYYAPPPIVAGRGPAASAPGTPRMDFVLDPERLPRNWLGFTSLRAVLLGPMEWQQLDPAQQDALLMWTASGGDLLYVDGAVETLLPPGQRPVGLGGTDSVVPYYLGNIHLLKSPVIREKGVENTLIDLGSAVATPDWSLPANRATDWGLIKDRGFRLPIEDAGNVPTRAYLLILALFIGLIGPVNYFYLWRKRQQVLLVVTVPLISAGFIFLITGYGLLSEGFDVRARAVTFTILDQNSKRAATRASVSLYPGGITPSGGVRYASDTAVFPLGTDGAGPRGQIALDLTDEQKFQSGLLQSRTPSNFEEITFQPARQRLNFERSGNELSVVNGLGANIQRLYYREAGQMYALAGPLAAGERAPLKIEALKGTSLFAEQLKSTSVSPLKFQQVIDRQPDGAYLAVLEKSPFWDPGIEKPSEVKGFHLVFGYAGGQP